jgi:DNA modification methylase
MSAEAPYRPGSDPSRNGAQYTTLGWTDCGHNTWRRGHVLDPFCGSGTTLAAAAELGRDATGIDIDERNLWLVRERVGLFLEEAG